MISAIGSDVATWHPPPPSYEVARPDTRSRVGLTQVVSSPGATLLRTRSTSASERSRSSSSRDIPAHSGRPRSSSSTHGNPSHKYHCPSGVACTRDADLLRRPHLFTAFDGGP